MVWYGIYDVSDGTGQGTAAFRLDDSVYAAQGQAQIEIPDGAVFIGVDITQNPLVPILAPAG